jgi:hypothetical protein
MFLSGSTIPGVVTDQTFEFEGLLHQIMRSYDRHGGRTSWTDLCGTIQGDVVLAVYLVGLGCHFIQTYSIISWIIILIPDSHFYIELSDPGEGPEFAWSFFQTEFQ